MTDYISARFLALVVALGLIISLCLLAKWGVLSSEAISGLLGVIAASLRDLLKKDSDASTPASPITIAGAGLLCAIFAGAVGGGCSPADSLRAVQAVDSLDLFVDASVVDSGLVD